MYGPAFITTTTTCGPRLRLATPPNVRLSAESHVKRLAILMPLDPHYISNCLVCLEMPCFQRGVSLLVGLAIFSTPKNIPGVSKLIIMNWHPQHLVTQVSGRHWLRMQYILGLNAY